MSNEVLAVVAGKEITNAELDAFFYRMLQENSRHMLQIHSLDSSIWSS